VEGINYYRHPNARAPTRSLNVQISWGAYVYMWDVTLQALGGESNFAFRCFDVVVVVGL